MNKIRKIFCIVLAICLTLSVVGCKNSKETENGEKPIVDSNVVFVEGGHSDYQIVIPADADECIKFSAQHLCEYVEKSTGVTLPIVTDTNKSFNPDDKYISLGNTTIKSGSGVTVSEEEVFTDGYKIVRKGNVVIIAGYLSRGTMYGVFEFLKIICEYEVYSSDIITYREKSKIMIPDADLLDKPSFIGRNMDGPIAKSDELQALLRMRSNRTGAAYGGGGYYTDWMDRHSETYYLYINVGNKTNGVFDEDANIVQHPRWFAHKNGVPFDNQLCFTNKECMETLVELVKKYILEHPEGIWVNISMNDNGGFCTCNEEIDKQLSWDGLNCEESRKKYTLSGTHIRWINEIIKRIEEWRQAEYPQRKVKYTSFAYGSLYPAPTLKNADGTYRAIDDSCIPDERLYVRWAPLMSCFSHEITDESCGINKPFADAIKGWSTICKRFNIYDYRSNYRHFLAFYNNFNAVQGNMQYYKSIGVTDYMIQNATGANVASLCDLHSYLNAKLLWNVNENLDELIDNFMDNFYGVGGKYMKDYLNIMRTHFASIPDYHQRCYNDTSAAAWWPVGLIETSLSLFEQANREIDKAYDSQTAAKYKLHILRESVCVRYVLLKNYASYYTKGSAEYVAAVAKFKEDVETVGANSYCEGVGMNRFYESL